MLDLAWSEIALIAVVALVVIGPKDLPEAVRGVARGIQKLRRMAGEFRSQADELVREANLDELRQQIHDIRNFNVRDEFEKAVDKDGSIRRSFDDPLRDTYTPPPPPPPSDAMEGAAAPAGAADSTSAAADAAPAFIPPADAASAAPSFGPPEPSAAPAATPEPAAPAATAASEPPSSGPPTATAPSAPTPAVHRT
ncbi:MAG: twin-arginine translocase subunit TatB [Acetobacteraceae bacterium]|nr:twin-arginine translocase subunit TatB [Acetobacteraceae bacterium]